LTIQLIALLTVSCLTGFAQSNSIPTIPAEAQQAARSVRPQAVEAHMRYLADDKLQGRKPGTPGYELAAQYVEKQFTSFGFMPGVVTSGGATFRQAVPLRKAQVREETSSLALIQDGKEQPLVYGRNFILSPNFGLPISEISAPVVFVGFGVSAPELGYDDYAGIDVRGKIVACFNGAPATFPSNQRAYSGSAKQEVAALHGLWALSRLACPPMSAPALSRTRPVTARPPTAGQMRRDRRSVLFRSIKSWLRWVTQRPGRCSGKQRSHLRKPV
jgi:hypothetical protein